MTVEELIEALSRIEDQSAFVEFPDGSLVGFVDDSDIDGGSYVVLRPETIGGDQ